MQKNINDIWLKPNIVEHSNRIIRSYAAITEHNLFDLNYSEEYLSYLVYHAPYVVVSHGIQMDPIFNYANLTAQQLWQLDWEQFTQLPSRATAEPERAEDRQQLLDAATVNGYIDNYEGIRISANQKRFKIQKVLLWNVPNEKNEKIGQAALFRNWTNI
jgi:hypothetical protein